MKGGLSHPFGVFARALRRKYDGGAGEYKRLPV
jgi:hypothetical protein